MRRILKIWNFSPNSKKVFILIIVLFSIFYFPIQISENLDNFFNLKFEQEILPHSEKEINFIVDQTNNILNDTEKLEFIADWEVNNFTYFLFEQSYRNSNYSIRPLDPPIYSYFYDSYGKIRATFRYFPLNLFIQQNQYVNNPYWITYYKMGGCGELAYLFANISNRSGYPTKVIGATIKDNNHAWVEININGELLVFDPSNYYFYKILRLENYNNTWLNKPETYREFSPQEVIEIHDEFGNDVIHRYPLMMKKPLTFPGNKKLYEFSLKFTELINNQSIRF